MAAEEQSARYKTVTNPEQSDLPKMDRATFDIRLPDLVQEKVRNMLKDPDSAKFRDLQVHHGVSKDGAGVSHETAVVCGEVNSKNAFGGYGGYKRFISAGTPESTFLEELVPADVFATAWDMFCRP